MTAKELQSELLAQGGSKSGAVVVFTAGSAPAHSRFDRVHFPCSLTALGWRARCVYLRRVLSPAVGRP